MTMNKKTKKASTGKNYTNSYPTTTEYNDQLALNRRAERFQREHELERTKHLRNGHQSLNGSNHHAYSHGNRTLNNSRAGSVVPGVDEPEGDPVSLTLAHKVILIFCPTECN